MAMLVITRGYTNCVSWFIIDFRHYRLKGFLDKISHWSCLHTFGILHFNVLTHRIHVCYIWYYMVTFTINIPQMLAYIPYMDPMGEGTHLFFVVFGRYVDLKSRPGHPRHPRPMASRGRAALHQYAHLAPSVDERLGLWLEENFIYIIYIYISSQPSPQKNEQS